MRALVVAVLLTPSAAFGWNKAAHQVIGSIAFRSMTPEARAKVIDVLKTHTYYSTWEKQLDKVLPKDRDEYLIKLAGGLAMTITTIEPRPDRPKCEPTAEDRRKWNEFWRWFFDRVIAEVREAQEAGIPLDVAAPPPEPQEPEIPRDWTSVTIKVTVTDCTSITKAGKQCKRPAYYGENCWQHTIATTKTD